MPRTSYSSAPALAILLAIAATGLSAAPATAGECVTTTRNPGGFFSEPTLGIHTTVKNASSTVYYGTIKRGFNTPKIVKQDKLQPGESTGLMLSIPTSTGEAAIEVEFTDIAGNANYSCKYNIVEDETGTTWAPTFSSGGGKTCPGTTLITCEKSYNPNKTRWNTVYTIQDLQ